MKIMSDNARRECGSKEKGQGLGHQGGEHHPSLGSRTGRWVRGVSTSRSSSGKPQATREMKEDDQEFFNSVFDVKQVLGSEQVNFKAW